MYLTSMHKIKKKKIGDKAYPMSYTLLSQEKRGFFTQSTAILTNDTPTPL